MIPNLRFLACIVALIAPAGAALSQVDQTRRFTVSISGDLYPIVTGTTDLPNGTRLLVNLKKPWLPDGQQRVAKGLAACGDDCFPATGPDGQMGIIVTVTSGQFVAGQFSFRGAPFKAGHYPLEISLSVDPRTATVEQIRGIGTVMFATNVEVPGNQTYRQGTTKASTKADDSSDQWRKIKADNGAWAGIDVHSIEPWSTGGAYAIICVADDGGPCPFLSMTRVLFDCHGHYTAIDRGGAYLPAPPLSLAGALANIACVEADRRRRR